LPRQLVVEAAPAHQVRGVPVLPQGLAVARPAVPAATGPLAAGLQAAALGAIL